MLALADHSLCCLYRQRQVHWRFEFVLGLRFDGAFVLLPVGGSTISARKIRVATTSLGTIGESDCDERTNEDGRPTKLTPELQEKICALIEAGNYAEVACKCVGISTSTFYAWRQRGEMEDSGEYADFAAAVDAAEAQAERKAVVMVQMGMREDPRLCMTFLERRFPARWQRRPNPDTTPEKRKLPRWSTSDSSRRPTKKARKSSRSSTSATRSWTSSHGEPPSNARQTAPLPGMTSRARRPLLQFCPPLGRPTSVVSK